MANPARAVVMPGPDEVASAIVDAVAAGCPWLLMWDQLEGAAGSRYAVHVEPIRTGAGVQAKLLRLLAESDERGPSLILVYYIEGPDLAKLAARWERRLEPGAPWRAVV